MVDLTKEEYKVFDMFKNQWAIVTAGNIEEHNGCTIGWGSLGTIWTKHGEPGSIVTVYVHPARYTCEFLKKQDTFTVSFFSEEYRKALGYMGSHSGRKENKESNCGLTPISIGNSVGYAEANLTFVCEKLYQGQFEKEGLTEDIREYYVSNPSAYPLNEADEWEPHWMFVGKIVEVKE